MEAIFPMPSFGLVELAMVVGALVSLVVLRRTGLLRLTACDANRRTPSELPWTVWLAMGFGIFLLQGIAAAVAMPDQNALAELPQSERMLRVTIIPMLVGYGAAIGGIAGILLYFGSRARRGGLGAKLVDLPIGLVALVALVPILQTVSMGGLLTASWLADMRGTPMPDPMAHELLRWFVEAPRDAAWWVMVASVVVGAPIVEEFLYRGCLQSVFASVGLPGWMGIGTVSALFTLQHAGAVDVHAMPTLFVLSMGLGVLFERTGRLGASIALHAVFNAANLVLVTFGFAG